MSYLSNSEARAELRGEERAWFASLWFFLVIGMVVALVVAWYAFMRPSSEQSVQSATPSTTVVVPNQIQPGQPGQTGATGATGSPGAPGTSGTEGATGAAGSSGSAGAPGAPGAAGAAGAAGAPGAPAPSNQGGQ